MASLVAWMAYGAILHGPISRHSVPAFLSLPNSTVAGGGALKFAMFSRRLQICKSRGAPEECPPSGPTRIAAASLIAILEVHAVKVALTAEQVARSRLPPSMVAKHGGQAKSPNYAKFVGKHGWNVFEVEALPPERLQAELRDAIDPTPLTLRHEPGSSRSGAD